jgi:branched-chain amino acid transport system ATP-binding protein
VSTDSANTPFIQAQGIQAWYGSSHVLHGINFHLAAGETVGLLGRNGMGKSTLIRSLLGHVKQREGLVHIGGREVSRAPAHQIARLGIAYVPEGRGIFPNLTVRENLVMAQQPVPTDRPGWTYEQVLATFPRLTERMGNLGSQLSGGEQQMLSIGRALLTQPRVIVLDEATEGLAPLIVAEIWRVIAKIRATGIATLVVDRDYRKVCQESDRLVVLQKGRVVLEGRSDELARSPELAGYLGV